MNSNFEKLLKAAAIFSLNEEIRNDESDLKGAALSVTLNAGQKYNLTEKILLLPEKEMFVLFSKYCFHLTPEETEFFFNIENADGYLRYYRKLLSRLVGLADGTVVSEDSLEKSCKRAIKAYVKRETQVNEHNGKILFFPKALSRMFIALPRQAAIILITVLIGISVTLTVNAEFRQKVISWVVEIFETYGIFEIKGEKEPDMAVLQTYKPTYLPKGFQLFNTVTQPSLILYEYGTDSGESLSILMSLSDGRIYMDTEGVELKEVDFEGTTAYYFEKDDSSRLIFGKDGYHFVVYGNVDKGEILKIAEGIKIK